MEKNTKEPTLEEYGLNESSYEEYRNEKSGLEKFFFKENNRKYYKSILGDVLGIGSIIAGIISESWSVFFVGIILATVVSEMSVEKQQKKDKTEQTKREKEIKEKLDFIYGKVFPFEEDSVNYYENYLKNFFESNLYKKRSGGEKFEESLSEFSSMIDEAEEISKKLIFTHISTYSHKSYLESRQTNHEYQKNKKPVFHSFDNVKIKSNNQEVLQTEENYNENLTSSYKREDSVNKQNQRVIEKEVIKPIPPEKKYRTARKIYNWEEINKNRKVTGDKGEEIALAIEQEYFESIGRKDLASRVRHVSVEDGDGLGYDILSFFEDEREKYIEVKSTTTSIKSPFNISKNELKFLDEHHEDSFICRVLVSDDVPQYKMIPSFEVLEGEIMPVSFLVRVGTNE